MDLVRAPTARRSRLARIIRAALWLMVFLCACVLGLVLHANVSAVRSTIATAVDDALAAKFRGKVTLLGLDQVGPTRVRLRELLVDDEDGIRVLSLQGIQLDVQPLQWFHAWISAPSAPFVIERVSVDRGQVELRRDARGQWTLPRAFESRAAPPPSRGRPARPVSIDRWTITELQLALERPGSGPLRAEMQRLSASGEFAGSSSRLQVEPFRVKGNAGDGLQLEGEASLRLAPGGRAATHIEGALGQIALSTQFEFGADRLDGALEIPELLPAAVRAIWPAWPLESPAALHMEAHGPASALQILARAQTLAGRVEATGEAALSGTPRARLRLSAESFDVRSLWPAAPATSLVAHAEIQLAREPDGLSLSAEGDTAPTHIAGIPLPGTRFRWQSKGAAQSADVDLADARGAFHAQLRSHAPGSARLDVHGRRVELGSWSRLGPRMVGYADLDLQAQLDRGRVDGKLNARVSQLAAAPLELGRGVLVASVHGRLSDLQNAAAETSFTATGLHLGVLALERAEWLSHGSAARSSFEARVLTQAGAHAELRGRLSLIHGLLLEDLAAHWSQRDLELSAEASRWQPERGSLRVENFAISGAIGQLRGEARLDGWRLEEFRGDAAGLDIGRLSRIFGAGGLAVEAHASGHAAFSTAAPREHAEIDLTLDDLNLRQAALGNFALRGTLENRHLAAELQSEASVFGHIDSKATLTLGGSALQAASWKKATGQASITLNDAPLWPIGVLLPKTSPIRELAGRVNLSLKLHRLDARDPPSAFVQANTSELSFALPKSNAADERETFDQLVLRASAALDGPSGHGAATLLVTDGHGALLSSSGSLVVDVPALLAHPDAVLVALEHAPLDVLIQLHQRPVAQLPGSHTDLGGSLEGTLALAGTLADPKLDLNVHGRDFAELIAGTPPVNASLSAHFVPRTGQLDAHADVASGRQGLVSARLDAQLLQRSTRLGDWELGDLRGAALINGVPLEAWPAAARQNLRARLYGSVALERRKGKLQERGHVELRALSMQGRALGSGVLNLHNAPDGTLAELSIGERGDRLHADRWSAALGADPARVGIEGNVQARGFEAGTLEPLVPGILSHLSGGLDGDLHFRLSPRLDGPAEFTVDGNASVQNASAHLDLFGLDLRDISGKIRARSENNRTTLSIDSVQATSHARSPNLTGSAEVRLEGVRVTSADARITLSDVLLSLRGAARGTARGRLDAHLERQADTLAVRVAVPEMRVQLPATSSRSLLSLEPNPDFHLGEAEADTEAKSTNNLLWKVDFELGNAVRLERTDLRLPITGQPELEFRDELHPSGSLETLPGARMTLFEQTFTIDHGVLQFLRDDPNNPLLDVTASWRAPDGTTIYIDITGPIDDARVTTRDDRGLSDADRFYLLTGNPAATTTTSSEPSAFVDQAGDRTALGQTFALGINQLLRGSLGNVAVSIGTTPDARASYSASLRLSDRLFFQGSYSPASENSRAQTTNDLTGTLDYQISRSWSLRTELGTTGGALDLLWSHRY
jgi:hypothetical protein